MAGGKGTRMKATCPKVMCEVLFSPMISYVVDAVKEAGAEDICVITGYKHELLEKYIAEKDEKIETVLQEPQLGTGARHEGAGDHRQWCIQGITP